VLFFLFWLLLTFTHKAGIILGMSTKSKLSFASSQLLLPPLETAVEERRLKEKQKEWDAIRRQKQKLVFWKNVKWGFLALLILFGVLVWIYVLQLDQILNQYGY
jgi:hypothetical protein